MCGVTGFLDSQSRLGADGWRRIAAAMATTLRHRGPDHAGVWTDPNAGVALAHRRLSVIDLSAAGDQPMTSSCGRCVLTYNGEIYNHAELRMELAALGRTFRGHSDSEVLVEACATWGVEATLERLVGMFAFAVWDRTARSLTLARDRLGLKPLFWGQFGTLFLFGSELKALRAHPGWRPEVDPAGVRAYMRWGHVPAPHCILKGLQKLLPGQYLVVKPGGEVRLGSYWDPAQTARDGQSARLELGEAEALARLDSLLGDAVARRMVADVPLGAFLSGGIDSSLIAALMQARSNRPVKTFTIAFDEKRYDESAYARSVADHLGTDHAEIMVTSADAVTLIPELPYWFDEPLAIRSQVPMMMLCALARRDVTVALSGDGGDELFGGYPGYYIVRAIHRTNARLSPPLRRLAAAGVDGLVDGVAALQSILPAARRPGLLANRLKQATVIMRAGGTIADYYAQLYNSTAGPLPLLGNGAEYAMRWQAPEHREVVDDPIDLMGYFALLGTLIDGTLAKVDRASMAYSLEVRVPFLDHRVVEYAWQLPPAIKYANKAGSKHLLRQLLYRHVPRALVDRPKKGFSSPLPVWLRGPLRDWAEDLLDERRLEEEGLFDVARVRSHWQQHLTASNDFWQLLWSVLVFRQWHSLWNSPRDDRTQMIYRPAAACAPDQRYDVLAPPPAASAH